MEAAITARQNFKGEYGTQGETADSELVVAEGGRQAIDGLDAQGGVLLEPHDKSSGSVS